MMNGGRIGVNGYWTDRIGHGAGLSNRNESIQLQRLFIGYNPADPASDEGTYDIGYYKITVDGMGNSGEGKFEKELIGKNDFYQGGNWNDRFKFRFGSWYRVGINGR